LTELNDLLVRLRTHSEAGHFDFAWGVLRTLVLTDVPLFELQKINRILVKHQAGWNEFVKNKRKRVAILGGYTTQPIRELMLPALLSEGFWAEIYEGNYNSFETEPLDLNSTLFRFKPDIVVIATGSKHIEFFPDSGIDEKLVGKLAEREIERLKIRWNAIKAGSNATIVQHNYEPPATLPLGRLEGRYSWSKTNFIHRLNSKLWECDGKEIRVLDMNQMAVESGRQKWHSPRWYYHSKHGFNPQLVSQYGWALAGLMRAILGKTRKCLAVDLDNTLWGGVIGDDGLGGIVLGNINPEGEAFSAFGLYLKHLKHQGVILVVNSKNDVAVAESVFRYHQECVLKMEDFSAFVCNWESKSSNLSRIAKSLNIGTESIVFVDDNKGECEEVRHALPEVNVIELSGDPAFFADQIERLHLFAPLDMTAEDLRRQESYQATKEISKLKSSPKTLSSYLENLNMRAIIRPAKNEEIPRINQLLQKTNQFNLTGRSFQNESLESLLSSNNRIILVSHLEDRLANHGLVSVLIGRIEKKTLWIENWVMSCRVFTRTLEEAIFLSLLDIANAKKCSEIRGHFLPTEKNKYVSNLYERLGFKYAGEEYFHQIKDDTPSIITKVKYKND